MHPAVKFAVSFAAFAILLVAPRGSQAQITNPIAANIHHSFIVGNTTLPPGHYTFRMIPQTEHAAMIVTSADGGTATEFLVRDSLADHTPKHTELVFNRYGNKELLTHIYEVGTKSGVAVMEASRAEERLKKQGQSATSHTEEQKK
ncbi:MAG: hypothetical protein WCA37_16820 [Terracidiphilus sp.]